MILQQVLNGFCQGSIYALMAIGYTMIVGITGLVTFAYGETIMIGAYAAFYSFAAFGTNLPLAFVFSFFASAILGIIIYKICYEKFLDAPRHIPLIMTIAMSILIKNLAMIIFGSEMKGMPNIFNNASIQLGNMRVSIIPIVILSLVIILCIGLSLFLGSTSTGLKLKAVVQDRKTAALMGINVRRTALLGNCVGCGLGGIAGILLSLYYNYLLPNMGSTASLKAFSSSVLGGLVNIQYSAIGGMLLGLLETLGISIWSTSIRDIIAFCFLIIMLMLFPKGIAKIRGTRL
jgi:branched-chain amino acid transport system permease protein